MHVRNAEDRELDRLADIWYEAWHDAHAQIVPPELTQYRTRESFRERLLDVLPDVRVVGAPGDPDGFCIVKDDELYQLFVSARSRGSGVAAVLMADAEATLSERGVRTAWLACAIGNERAARFYEKCGWRRAGTTINHLDTPGGVIPLEVWRYEKSLTEGGAPACTRNSADPSTGLVRMPLTELSPVDTRPLFRPVSVELVALLRRLSPAEWERPTVAGTWSVRDIVAHLVDLTFRRLSFHRDRMAPPPPPGPIGSERDFVDFINWLNGQWVGVAKRFSPRVLTDLFELASADLADWFEALPLDAPALFGVSWAGEQTSEGWFDVGREFTELWHHQEQIRMAVGAPSLPDPRYLRAVIDVSIRGLPHAYRTVNAEPGATVFLDVTGPAGGQWTLTREPKKWTLSAGEPPVATARIRVSDGAAWKLLFNALRDTEAAAALHVEGRAELAEPLERARSVIV